MDINNLKIIPPEGMEYYIENGEIRFRRKHSLDDVYNNLFCNAEMYFVNDFGWVGKRLENNDPFDYEDYTQYRSNCTSERQAQKLLAINELMNVAKYLNDGWKPDWNNGLEEKYYLYINNGNKLCVYYIYGYNKGPVYFKSEELARQAIEILGEETIKLALCTDW